MDASMEDIQVEQQSEPQQTSKRGGRGGGRGNRGGRGARKSHSEAQQHQQQTESTEETPPLDPSPFSLWSRSIQRKLLALNDGMPQGLSSNDQERSDLLSQLSSVYQQIDQAPLSLSTNENLLRSSLSILSLYSSGGGSGTANSGTNDPNLLKEILNLHNQSTRFSNGSSMDHTAYSRFISLILTWHYQWESITPTSQEEDGESTISKEGQDPLLRWTNTTGGPRLNPNTAGYVNSSLPKIPSQKQAESLGLWEQFDELFSEENVRTTVREAYTRIALHSNQDEVAAFQLTTLFDPSHLPSTNLQQSHKIWTMYRDFEVAHLIKSEKSEESIELVKQVYVARLRIPNRGLEQTFQDFSSFVSTYLSPEEYESLMTSTQSIYSKSLKIWRDREKYEDSIQQVTSSGSRSSYSTDWKPYLKWSINKMKYDSDFVSSLFERCILDTRGFYPTLESEELENPPSKDWEDNRKKSRTKMSREKKEERNQLEKLERDTIMNESENVWEDYILFMSSFNEATLLVDVCSRSIRCRPDSGTLWSHYLRILSKLRRSKASQEEIFSQAIQGGMLTSSKTPVSNLVSLLISRIDIEREEMAMNLSSEKGIQLYKAHEELSSDIEKFMNVYAVQSYALDLLSQRGSGENRQDEELKLETLSSDWLERGGENTSPLAGSIWENASKLQPFNGRVAIESSRFYSKHGDIKKARNVLKQAVGKFNMKFKDEILKEWERFELVFGSVNDILYCRERCKKETEKLWEAWYNSQQQAYATQAQTDQTSIAYAQPVMDAEMEDASSSIVDNSQVGQKRKAVEDPPMQQQGPSSSSVISPSNVAGPSDDSKKGRMGDKKQTRDRENCSIVVSGLSASAVQADLYTLFKDCGEIVEVDGPKILRSASSTNHQSDEMDTDNQDPSSSENQGLSAAVVEFSDRSAVPAAKTKDKKKLNGMQISISLGWECTLFVTNFSEAWTDAEVRRRFGKYGLVFNVRWPSKKFQASRRFCYVQFTEAQAAQAALVEHGQETVPGQSLQVLLSDPSRKKTRTDANANDKELYVSALPRSIEPSELKKLFESHGKVSGFRMPTYQDGKYKGIAFIDYETPLEAQVAIGKLNGTRLNGKEISVQLVDKNRSGKDGGGNNKFYKGKNAEERSKSLRVHGLPFDAQEPIIQQTFESITDGPGSVVKVEWTAGAEGRGEAIIEFSDAAIAGKVLLLPSVIYESSTLTLSSLDNRGAAAPIPTASTSGQASTSSSGPSNFMPRAAGRGRGRGRGGLGFIRPRATPKNDESMEIDGQSNGDASVSGDQESSNDQNGGGVKGKGKSQDAFRQMLSGGK